MTINSSPQIVIDSQEKKINNVVFSMIAKAVDNVKVIDFDIKD